MKHKKGDTMEFASLGAAGTWLHANGYSYGPMQRSAPIGVMRGEDRIPKWENMSAEERDECTAVLRVDIFAPDALRLADRPWWLTWQHDDEEGE